MLQKMRVLLLVCITAVLAACGGGGSEGGGATGPTPNFEGNYQISTAILTSNSCGGSPATSISAGVDTIVQNGRNVSASGGAVTGTVDDDNGGFTLSKREVTNGVTAVVSMKFRLTTAGASTFTVQINGVGSNGNVSCAITYTGTATKS